MANFIEMLKQNWIGAGIGGVIGFMNIGATYISALLHNLSFNIVEFFVKLPPCDCPTPPMGCMCADVIFPELYTQYTIFSIIILMISGAFIQSKLKK